MPPPSLSAEASLGASTPQILFQNSSQTVCVAGQRLKFTAANAPLEPDETRWLPSSSPHGISLVATCPRAKLFAYTERVLQPKISICSFPDMLPHSSLDGPAPLEYTAMAFSRDGTQLAALSGQPEPTLVVWSLATGEILSTGALLVPCPSVSFDPMGSGRICTCAPKRLLVWTLKLVYKTYLLESEEVPLPEEEEEEEEAEVEDVAIWTSSCWSAGSALYASSESGTVCKVLAPTADAPNGASGTILRCGSPVRCVQADATHLLVGCGDGTLRWYILPEALDELEEEASLLWSMALESPLASLTYAPDFSKLIVAAEDGEMHYVAYLHPLDELPLEPTPVIKVLTSEVIAAFHTGPVVSSASMAVFKDEISSEVASYDVVTCSADGTLRCFDTLTRMQLQSISTASNALPTSIAACSASSLVALGTADGVLRLYKRRPDQTPLLLLVWRERLSTAAVEKLAFSADGTYLAAACADKTLLTLKFQKGSDVGPSLLPHFLVPDGHGKVTSLAWADEFSTAGKKLLVATDKGKVYLVEPAAAKGVAGDEVSMAGAPHVALAAAAVAIAEAPPSTYPKAASAKSSGAVACFFAATMDKKVGAFTIPKNGAVGNIVDPLEKGVDFGLEKPPTSLTLSYDKAFLAVADSCGSLSVAPVDALAHSAAVGVHESVAGGATGICLVPDKSPAAPKGAALAFSTGADGTMFLTTVAPGSASMASAPFAGVRLPLALKSVTDAPTLRRKTDGSEALDSLLAEGGVNVTPAEGVELVEEPTLIEAAKTSATEKVESAARDGLHAKVEAVRDELMTLIGANELLPDDDPEKLTREDFILDLAQQQAWREEGTAKVDELKEKIKSGNLANELVAKRMRDEFWEAMAEPSVTLHALTVPGIAPNRQLGGKVTSYTIPKPQAATEKSLAMVKLLRRVEMHVSNWEAAEEGGVTDAELPYRPSTSFEEAATFGNDVARVLSAAELREKLAKQSGGKEGADGKKDDKAAGAAEAEAEEEEEKADEGEGGGMSIDDSKLLYKPFELQSKWRKVSQIRLHGEVQGKLKAEFNQKHKALLNFKRGELEKIKEKQERIGEIEEELSRLNSQSDGEVTTPFFISADEEPEKLLEVSDSEITAPKWVSPEEQARLAKAEEERRLRELEAGKDNLGARGLIAMMNGTLETRREEDAIFVDLVKPEWMDKVEDPTMLTDNEKEQIKDFEKAVAKLEAEREKRSKGLLTELAKLRQDISDICTNFNERVKALKETKMVFDTAIYEGELLVIRLAQARLSKEQFEAHSKELDGELAVQQGKASGAAGKLALFQTELARQAEKVEALTEEDKKLEKAFKKEFADVPDFFEPLKKLFNRRKMATVPKGSREAAKKAKEAAASGAPSMAKKASSRSGTAMMVAVQSRGADGGGDGGADYEIAGGRDPFASLDEPPTEQVVEALDAGDDMPEGLSFDVWDRLVEARNAKVDSEEKLKEASKVYEEMKEAFALVDGDDRGVRERIDLLTSTLSQRSEDELKGAWNLELPFKLKQGQVEVEEAAVVTDFGGALLIHRGEVANLNKEIRKLGKEKVDILKEIRDFRKGIVMLEWENSRSDMECDDLIERTKEFQLLRVTKDLQDKIRGGGDGESQQVEVAMLERKMEQMKAAHEDKVADLRRQVAKINAMIADRNNEMASLQGQIEQLEGSVLEREMIHSIQAQSKDGNGGGGGDSYKRFEELHMKRKLQTLVGMQTQEIGLLRDELDRLRRRTFPTFTHIDASRGDM